MKQGDNMKVLSLKEPFASLVMQKIKQVETRSWKTKYRGVLYIHASLGKVKTTDEKVINLLKLLNNSDLKYGYIIAKCNLVDCIYMDENYLDKIKLNKTEYQCGIYEIGRHAWILDNIEVLDNPISAKGKLGIWNYEENGEIL